MKEKDILRLVKAASELEEFEAHLREAEAKKKEAPSDETETGHTPAPTSPATRSGRKHAFNRFRVAVTGLAAAIFVSVLVVFWMSWQQLVIEDLSVDFRTFRGEQPGIELEFALSQPAHVRVVVIDTHHERWVMPIADGSSEYVKLVERHASIPLPLNPAPEETGVTKALAVLLIASLDESPTAEDLLRAIPDPVVSPESEEQELFEALDRIVGDLESRFDCIVRFCPVHKK